MFCFSKGFFRYCFIPCFFIAQMFFATFVFASVESPSLLSLSSDHTVVSRPVNYNTIVSLKQSSPSINPAQSSDKMKLSQEKTKNWSLENWEKTISTQLYQKQVMIKAPEVLLDSSISHSANKNIKAYQISSVGNQVYFLFTDYSKQAVHSISVGGSSKKPSLVPVQFQKYTIKTPEQTLYSINLTSDQLEAWTNFPSVLLFHIHYEGAKLPDQNLSVPIPYIQAFYNVFTQHILVSKDGTIAR